MKQTAIAVIGCGAIANNAHLPAFAVNNEIRLKYCVDIVEERAKAAAEKYHAETYLTDYKGMLADPEVEAVFVLTPNYTHAGISMDCLNAGKNVFCEKPISVNYDLSCKMAECAKKNKKLLEIGVCNRYNTSVEKIKELIGQGRLGEVYHVVCSFRSYRSIPGLGGDFTAKDKAGGGVLIDWGIHFLDLILYATGMPRIKTVSANTYSKLAKNISDYTYVNMWAEKSADALGVNDVEEYVTGFIRTEGASVSFNGAWAQNIAKDEMYIDFLGDKAGIRLNYGEKFTLYSEENGMLLTSSPDYRTVDHYGAETSAFIRAIRTGEITRNNIVNVLESAKLLDTIYASDASGKEIVL